VASLLCGTSELAVMLLTDYPGGVKRFLSFQTHRELDYALAALYATIPDSLALEGANARRFFRLQGALITLLGELTQSSAVPAKRQRARAA
jgi:hypothetical protein